MTTLEFVVRRLIRLYPMILVGVAVGSVVLMADTILIGRTELVHAALVSAASLVLFPLGLAFHQQAYPVNNPMWSLFFELWANLAYGIQARLSGTARKILLAAAAIFATALVFLIYSVGSIYTVGFGGVALFCGGFIRVAYPFLAGVIIFRLSLFERPKTTSPTLISLALLLLLFCPLFITSWLYESLVIVVIFPLMVIFGANASGPAWITRIWKVCGQLSYPFYIVHQPVLRATYKVYAYLHPPGGRWLYAGLSLAIVAGFSYAALVVYDEPVRRRLTNAYRDFTKRRLVSQANAVG